MRLSGEVYGAKCTRYGESGYPSSTASLFRCAKWLRNRPRSAMNQCEPNNEQRIEHDYDHLFKDAGSDSVSDLDQLLGFE